MKDDNRFDMHAAGQAVIAEEIYDIELPGATEDDRAEYEDSDRPEHRLSRRGLGNPLRVMFHEQN